MICLYCSRHSPAFIAAHGGCGNPRCLAFQRRKAEREAANAELDHSAEPSPRHAHYVRRGES